MPLASVVPQITARGIAAIEIRFQEDFKYPTVDSYRRARFSRFGAVPREGMR